MKKQFSVSPVREREGGRKLAFSNDIFDIVESGTTRQAFT
jgi:hypothetical protein